MNILEFVTAQDVRSQIEREQQRARNVIQMAEMVAAWRLRIRLWNLVYLRYREALRENNQVLASRLYHVLLETRTVVWK